MKQYYKGIPSDQFIFNVNHGGEMIKLKSYEAMESGFFSYCSINNKEYNQVPGNNVLNNIMGYSRSLEVIKSSTLNTILYLLN